MTKPGLASQGALVRLGLVYEGPLCRLVGLRHAHHYVPIATGASESSGILLEFKASLSSIALLEVIRREMVAGPLSLE